MSYSLPVMIGDLRPGDVLLDEPPLYDPDGVRILSIRYECPGPEVATVRFVGSNGERMAMERLDYETVRVRRG